MTASAVDILFANATHSKKDYVHLADLLVQSRPKRIGLVMSGDSVEFPIWYLLRERLSDREMPTIVNEIGENEIDRAAEFVVYIDGTARVLVADNMTRIEGFDQIKVYRSKHAAHRSQNKALEIGFSRV